MQYYIAQIGNSSNTACDEQVTTVLTQVSPVSINGTTVTISINRTTTDMDMDSIVVIVRNIIGCDVSDPLSLIGKMLPAY